MANTDLADINEIYLGYFLAGESWFDKNAKKQVDAKTKKINDEKRVEEQIERARVMADEVVEWARKNGYRGKISSVVWTARPGSMTEAVGREVDQRKNPSDILIRFNKGPADGFLGISAKSTKGKSDIGFKNPGIGTMERALGLDLKSIPDKYVEMAIEAFKLSSVTSQRKLEIRRNPKVKVVTEKWGTQALNELREVLYKKLKRMKSKDLMFFILNHWLDATDTLYPPYIKVTGMGTKNNYHARVEDPLKNRKIESITSERIMVSRVGNDSVGLNAGGYRVLKMRFKYESQKLASSVKLSGDPW